MNLKDLKEALKDSTNDSKDEEKALEAKNVKVIVLDRETLTKVTEIQVPGLTSIQLSNLD